MEQFKIVFDIIGIAAYSITVKYNLFVYIRRVYRVEAKTCVLIVNNQLAYIARAKLNNNLCGVAGSIMAYAAYGIFSYNIYVNQITLGILETLCIV